MATLIGLRTWDANGIQTLEITDRLTRHLGVITVSGNGAINVPEWATQPGWLQTLDTQTPGTGTTQPPIPTISGTTLSWAINDLPGNPPSRSIIIIYGVY